VYCGRPEYGGVRNPRVVGKRLLVCKAMAVHEAVLHRKGVANVNILEHIRAGGQVKCTGPGAELVSVLATGLSGPLGSIAVRVKCADGADRVVQVADDGRLYRRVPTVYDLLPITLEDELAEARKAVQTAQEAHDALVQACNRANLASHKAFCDEWNPKIVEADERLSQARWRVYRLQDIAVNQAIKSR
jgi:hypothetical protein